MPRQVAGTITWKSDDDDSSVSEDAHATAIRATPTMNSGCLQVGHDLVTGERAERESARPAYVAGMD